MPTPAPTSIEVACSKPGCDWKGPAAEAPGHACPTITKDLAQSSSADLEDEREGLEGMVVDGTELGAIHVDAEPETRGDMELWLNEHGNYSDDGVPADEKTARIDARLSSMEEEPLEGHVLHEDEDPGGQPAPAPDPEPELEDEPPAEERIAAEERPTMDDLAAAEGEGVDVENEAVIPADLDLQGSGEVADSVTAEAVPGEPWQATINRDLENMSAVAANKWLVVLMPTDTEQAELVGRGRIKSDAEEVAAKTAENSDLAGRELQVVKTQAVLDAAHDYHTGVEPESDDEPKTAQDAAAEAKAAAPKVEPSGQTALLDKSRYDDPELQIAKVDGQTIDRIGIKVSGGVMLDRSDKADVALYRRLELGKEVELRVAGKVSGTGAHGATNKDGELDVVVGEKTIRVTTVYVIPAEEL